jgi:O-antigen/teichoic acid export membrane protein
MSSQNFSMKSYMKGALLLTLAALIVKVLSAAYRVPFQNIVGDQGFYVYQQVYPFVAIFVTWTAGGVAVAISKMLANLSIENAVEYAKRQAINKILFSYLTVLSLLFFSVLFFGAPLLAHFMADDGLIFPLKVGAVVTLFMPILAILKGSFQSRGLLEPIAYSQVFEQGVRVSVILIGTILVMNTTGSVYDAGTTAIFGTVIGELACIFLLAYFILKQRRIQPVEKVVVAKWPVIKEVTLFSLSVSMSSLLLLGYQLIDSFTVFSTLVELGIPFSEAQTLKGIYDRGQPLVQLGLVIATSLALAIVPLIAFRISKKGGRGAMPFIHLTYKASIVFAVAASMGLVVIMPFINEALFKTNELSSVLAIYCLQIIPLSLILTLTAILQGYNKLLIPACLIVLSLLMKIIGNALMIPVFLLNGVAVTSVVSLSICAIGLIIYLRKVCQAHLATWSFYWHLLLATISMIVSVKLIELIIGSSVSIQQIGRVEALAISLLLIAVGAFVFITIVAKLRILKEKEWFVIPLGRKMAAYQLWLNRKKK